MSAKGEIRSGEPADLARVEAIFSEALGKSAPAERAAYLDQVCGTDTGLRQRVERLLASHATAGSFMVPPDPEHTLDPYIPLQEGPGSKIGRYKLLEQIGEGGFGVVFMAEQEQPVRRRVALKIIKLGMDTRQVVARFEAERQALAMMDHPSVAKVLDGGVTDTGRPYFVMELVKGTRITAYCDKNNLSIPNRLELFAQVCQAVQHAHQKGLIHRDIKPSNVLVATQDDRPVVKVIDFGIAKAIQARLTEKTLFTDFRQMIGTPEYMSPEQAEGDLDIDTRCDVYALGVLLYELLAGSPPFDGKELRSKAFAEMQRIIREVEPPAPSTRLGTIKGMLPSVAAHRSVEPRKLAAIVHGELDWIVMRCLEKDRNRRYQTASALVEDIQHYLTDEPVQARPPTRTYRMKKFIRRNKAGVLAGSAIVAALILGLTLASIGFIQARHQAIRADREAKNTRTQAARSEQVAQFLKDMLQGVAPSVALGRDTTMLREIVDKTAARIGTNLKDQPEVAIELQLTLAQVYFDLQLYKGMEETAREVLRLARTDLGEENLAVADALSQIGRALMFLRRIDEAESFTRRAIELQRKWRGPDSAEEAAALLNLGDVLRHQEHSPRGTEHELKEAEAVCRAGLAILKKRFGNDSDEVAWALRTLTIVLGDEGKRVESEAVTREALGLFQHIHGDNHPYTASAYQHLGGTMSLDSAERAAEAEEYLRRALNVQVHLEGKGKVSQIYSHSGLADVLEHRGDSEEAEVHRREALTIARSAMGPEYADLPEFIVKLANSLRRNGKLSEARSLAEEAVAMCQQHPNEVERRIQDQAYGVLGDLLTQLGDTATAKALGTKPSQTLEARKDTPTTQP